MHVCSFQLRNEVYMYIIMCMEVVGETKVCMQYISTPGRFAGTWPDTDDNNKYLLRRKEGAQWPLDLYSFCM